VIGVVAVAISVLVYVRFDRVLRRIFKNVAGYYSQTIRVSAPSFKVKTNVEQVAASEIQASLRELLLHLNEEIYNLGERSEIPQAREKYANQLVRELLKRRVIDATLKKLLDTLLEARNYLFHSGTMSEAQATTLADITNRTIEQLRRLGEQK